MTKREAVRPVSPDRPGGRPVPDGLAERGRRYWESVDGGYALSDSEAEVLVEVCRTLDTLDDLAAQVATHGTMVEGSAGQPVLNPAVAEARGQRLLVHRLMAALALPDEDGATLPSAKVTAGRASQAQWTKPGA